MTTMSVVVERDVRTGEERCVPNYSRLNPHPGGRELFTPAEAALYAENMRRCNSTYFSYRVEAANRA